MEREFEGAVTVARTPGSFLFTMKHLLIPGDQATSDRRVVKLEEELRKRIENSLGGGPFEFLVECLQIWHSYSFEQFPTYKNRNGERTQM